MACLTLLSESTLGLRTQFRARDFISEPFLAKRASQLLILDSKFTNRFAFGKLIKE